MARAFSRAGSILCCLFWGGAALGDAPPITLPSTGQVLDWAFDPSACQIDDGAFECFPTADRSIGISVSDTGLVESLRLIWENGQSQPVSRPYDALIGDAIGPFYRGVFTQGDPCDPDDPALAHRIAGEHGVLMVISGYSVSTTSPPCADYVPPPRRWHMVFGTGGVFGPCLLHLSATQSARQARAFSETVADLHSSGWSCQALIQPQ